VGQARRAEHESQRQRDEVELRRVARAVLEHRLQHRLALRGGGGGVTEQRRQVEARLRQHPDRHEAGARDEQDGLDDLHPGRALHAADENVDDHEDADDGDDAVLAGVALDAEQQVHQGARAGHLRQQVEERDGERRDRRRGPHRALPQPEAEDVREREPAGVPQQLGHQQQRHQPGDEEADRVEEAVVAVDGDRARDAEEARGGQVVAGDRDAVLAAVEGAAGGVVVGGGAVVARRPEDDAEGDEDEQAEDGHVEERLADVLGRRGCHEGLHFTSPASMWSRSCSATGSNSRSAQRA
jgi:hypothetical protein